jgi:hypothetical protein
LVEAVATWEKSELKVVKEMWFANGSEGLTSPANRFGGLRRQMVVQKVNELGGKDIHGQIQAKRKNQIEIRKRQVSSGNLWILSRWLPRASNEGQQEYVRQQAKQITSSQQ